MSVTPSSGEKPSDLAAKLWGYPEVAEVFGVRVTTVQRWVRLGNLPKPMRFGKRPMWPADQIRAIVNSPKESD